VKLDLKGLGTGGSLAARWINPATDEEHRADNIDRDNQEFTTPSGWDDALLHIYVAP
jgi:hypothetical protein